MLITMKTGTAYRVRVKVENVQNTLLAVNDRTDLACQRGKLVLVCDDALVLAQLMDMRWD